MSEVIICIVVGAISYYIGHYHGFCSGIKDEQELNNQKIKKDATGGTDNTA